MSSVVLSAAVRSNLLSLQNTASLLDTTQTRLATGNKVNSALDNPTSYFTASALSARASDLGNLLDSVSNAVQTIQAANDGITGISKLVESAQATANQAQQLSAGVSTATLTGSSFSTLNVSGAATTASIAFSNYSNIDLSTGSVSFDLDLDGFTQVVPITLDATAVMNYNAFAAPADQISDISNLSITDFRNLLNTVEAADYGPQTFSISGSHIVLSSPTTGAAGSVGVSGLIETGISGTTGLANHVPVLGVDAAAVAFNLDTNGTAHAVSISAATVSSYNSAHGTSLAAGSLGAQDVADIINAQVGSSVVAVDTGALKFTLVGASPTLGISGFSTPGSVGGSTGLGNSSATVVTAANPARAALVGQYNGLLAQIDQLAKDAGYNGNNLLTGSATTLKVVFNETGSSSLTISGKDASAAGLGLAQIGSTAFDSNTSITSILATLKSASDTLRSDASAFGSNLSIVQTRQDFTKALINTLQTGASNLTLADSNEEAANLLALQTRQSLSTKALSLASQSDQNVLRLLQ